MWLRLRVPHGLAPRCLKPAPTSTLRFRGGQLGHGVGCAHLRFHRSDLFGEANGVCGGPLKLARAAIPLAAPLSPGRLRVAARLLDTTKAPVQFVAQRLECAHPAEEEQRPHGKATRLSIRAAHEGITRRHLPFSVQLLYQRRVESYVWYERSRLCR